MKFEELKGKTQDELKKLLLEKKKELFNFRFQKVSGELEKTHAVAIARKDVAKINTALKQLEKGEIQSKTAKEGAAKKAPKKAAAKKTTTKKKAA